MDDDMKVAVDHLRNHITYPATADELKRACNDMSDVTENLKQQFMEILPEGTYNSADEVMLAVNWT